MITTEDTKSIDFLRWLCQTQARITFTDKAGDLESYPEPGMRATLTKFEIEYDDPYDMVYRISLNFEPHREHNLVLESSNYYDKFGLPRLTAREAGFYKPRDFIFVGDNWHEYFYFSGTSEDMTLLGDGYKALANEGEGWNDFIQRMAVEHLKTVLKGD